MKGSWALLTSPHVALASWSYGESALVNIRATASWPIAKKSNETYARGPDNYDKFANAPNEYWLGSEMSASERVHVARYVHEIPAMRQRKLHQPSLALRLHRKAPQYIFDTDRASWLYVAIGEESPPKNDPALAKEQEGCVQPSFEKTPAPPLYMNLG